MPWKRFGTFGNAIRLATMSLRHLSMAMCADAYADGVQNWDAIDRVEPLQRRSMDAPLGKKLRAAGYDSLWSYFDRQGFDELDRFRSDLDYSTLTPAGFFSYVIEVANEDGNWESGKNCFAKRLRFRH